MRCPGGVEAEEGDPSFPEVFVGAMPSSTSDFEKRTSSRCLPFDALSYRTSRTGRTARMTLGVYLGEIPPRMPIPQGGYRSGGQRVGSSEFFYRY